ncbi:circadian clock protein LdpA [Altericista sp. CCNU0014]|uniref:circadian clock protein LdpA n=1 Tax=Altericista sp. CCNU0014 TaxID=3082949 RepID=UPI0038507E96
MADRYSPLNALQNGHWFKLICGASFQHLPAIRTLALVYTLAGADCIDVAADSAAIYAARSGVEAAQALLEANGSEAIRQVWLMASLNDGEDPHFRKAVFDPQHCPPDCPQPCVSICPAQAIAFSPSQSGVMAERCYGCGRCLPICPVGQIETRSQPATPASIQPLVREGIVSALELHTQVGHEAEFQHLWQQIQPALEHLKVLAVSCPDGEGALAYLSTLYDLMKPLPCPLVWQTDGRPMSGDIGDGATRATINYGERVLRSPLPGFVQLAGGTNRHTVPKLKERGLLKSAASELGSARPWIAGVAYGSYARSLLSDIQVRLEAMPQSSFRLEDYPDLLGDGVDLAAQLIAPLKG